MPTIVIRLDAEKLENPDLDLRYEIPDLLAQRSGDLASDAGYTHDFETDALLMFLATTDVAAVLPLAIALLETDRLHGNDLAAAAMIATSERELAEVDQLEVVYPAGTGAVIELVPDIDEQAFRLRP